MPVELTAVSLVCTAWVLTATTLIGIGSLILGVLEPTNTFASDALNGNIPILQAPNNGMWPDTRPGLLFRFFAGFCTVSLILQIMHLFLPVKPWLTFVFILAGVIGIIRHHREILSELSLIRKLSPLCTGLILCLAVWHLNRSIGPAINDDTGLYHIPLVRWITRFPVMHGLGTLFPPFGINNSSFLYDALFETGPLVFYGHHAAGGILLAVGLYRGIVAMSRLKSCDAIWPLREGYWTVAFFCLFPELFSGHMNGYSTDLPILMLGLCLGEILLSMSVDQSIAARRLPLLALFAAAGITIKLLFTVMGGAILLSGLILYLIQAKRVRLPRKQMRTTILLSAICTGLLIIPWMTRGIIQTGYWAFPLEFSAVNVPWKAPEITAKALRFEVNAFNFFPTRHIEYFHNEIKNTFLTALQDWLSYNIKDFWTYIHVFLPALIGLGILILLLKKRRNSTPDQSEENQSGIILYLLAVLPWLISIAVWIKEVPRERYAGSSFFVPAILAILLANHHHLPVIRNIKGKYFLSLAILLSLISVSAYSMKHPQRAWPVIFSQNTFNGFAPTPQRRFRAYQTRWGDWFLAPDENPRVWNTPFPSTPWLNKNWRLIRHGDLSSGFIEDTSPTPPDQEKLNQKPPYPLYPLK